MTAYPAISGDGRDLIAQCRRLSRAMERHALRRAGAAILGLAIAFGWPLPWRLGIVALGLAGWLAYDLVRTARLHGQARLALDFLLAREREQRTQAARAFIASGGRW